MLLLFAILNILLACFPADTKPTVTVANLLTNGVLYFSRERLAGEMNERTDNLMIKLCCGEHKLG